MPAGEDAAGHAASRGATCKPVATYLKEGNLGGGLRGEGGLRGSRDEESGWTSMEVMLISTTEVSRIT